MKQLLQTLTILIFLIAAITLLFISTDYLSSQDGDAVIISITDEGFSPEEIHIQNGERVRFENRGSDWYWPASNLHPTHELYPEFDPREPLAPGDSWTFQFDEVGNWPFHDHLRPNKRGTVFVSD